MLNERDGGVNGVKFGLIMPGKPSVGDKFYLEDAPGAVERVEIVDLDAKLETITLEDLCRRAEASGIESEARTRLDFSI